MNAQRIGNILIERGLLDATQVNQVLAQQQTNSRPFGKLSAELFGLDEHDIYHALADQILSHSIQEVNLVNETIDHDCLAILSAHDAWDYLVLPLRMENHELICATTVETLPQAIGLMQRAVDMPFKFVVTEIRPLEQFIAEQYDYEGVDIDDDNDNISNLNHAA